MASKIVNLFDKIVDEATDVISADKATKGATKGASQIPSAISSKIPSNVICQFSLNRNV